LARDHRTGKTAEKMETAALKERSTKEERKDRKEESPYLSRGKKNLGLGKKKSFIKQKGLRRTGEEKIAGKKFNVLRRKIIATKELVSRKNEKQKRGGVRREGKKEVHPGAKRMGKPTR